MPGRAPSSLYCLIGNRLCIDFANSGVAPVGIPDPIHDWAAFLDLLVAIGALEPMTAKALGFLRGRECADVLRAADFLRAPFALPSTPWPTAARCSPNRRNTSITSFAGPKVIPIFRLPAPDVILSSSPCAKMAP